MLTVDLHEVKTNLPRLLMWVAAGEFVAITVAGQSYRKARPC
jgi:antitoxin (DNA-binding transcriptional repressor) of toxin-antitoxin stability system